MNEDFKIEEQYPVSEFELGKKEKVGESEAQEIQYTLKPKDSKASLRVSLWLDTKTHLPLKRVAIVTVGADKGIFTEKCSKLTLDPKVEAKTFTLLK